MFYLPPLDRSAKCVFYLPPLDRFAICVFYLPPLDQFTLCSIRYLVTSSYFIYSHKILIYSPFISAVLPWKPDSSFSCFNFASSSLFTFSMKAASTVSCWFTERDERNVCTLCRVDSYSVAIRLTSLIV